MVGCRYSGLKFGGFLARRELHVGKWRLHYKILGQTFVTRISQQSWNHDPFMVACPVCKCHTVSLTAAQLHNFTSNKIWTVYAYLTPIQGPSVTTFRMMSGVPLGAPFRGRVAGLYLIWTKFRLFQIQIHTMGLALSNKKTNNVVSRTTEQNSNIYE